jgi:hypothetical protein
VSYIYEAQIYETLSDKYMHSGLAVVLAEDIPDVKSFNPVPGMPIRL